MRPFPPYGTDTRFGPKRPPERPAPVVRAESDLAAGQTRVTAPVFAQQRFRDWALI